MDAARRWLESRPDEGTPNEEMARVIDLWQRTLDAIASQDFSGVEQEIDWVIKRALLLQVKDKLGAEWDHPKLAQIDLTYHDINRERGLFYLLERKALVRRWTTDEAIAHAATAPPETTRASLRGRFLSAARSAGMDHNVDWVHLKTNRPEPRTLELLDPFATEDQRVDEFIAHIRAMDAAD